MVAQGCLPPGANVFVAAPTPAIRSPIDIIMVTTMALVWTVNSTLSWGCNYVMQWFRLIRCNCQKQKENCCSHCWIRPAMQTPICQKWPNFRIPYFCPSKCRPLHSVATSHVRRRSVQSACLSSLFVGLPLFHPPRWLHQTSQQRSTLKQPTVTVTSETIIEKKSILRNDNRFLRKNYFNIPS